jgi:hypothetical protein
MPAGANIEYQRGLRLWKRSSPGSLDRQAAITMISSAAKAGHENARIMAKLHRIDF